MNPLGKNVSHETISDNPLNSIMQFLNNGGNPQQLFNQAFGNNEQTKQFLAQMQNMAGSKSPKDFALELARQKGIDTDQLMQVAQKLGAKK